MKTQIVKNPLVKTCLALAAVLVPVASLHAATIAVQTGGDFLSNSSTANGLGNYTVSDPNATTRSWHYNSTNATFSSTINTPYSGPTIYAALQTEASGGAAVYNAVNMVNGATAGADLYRFRSPNVSDQTTSISGLVFVQQASFLNSLNSGNLTFDSTSTFSLANVNRTASSTGSIKAAVLSNGTWYVSQSTHVAATGSVFSIANMASENWGAWAPNTQPFDAIPGTFGTVGSSLSNITAMGFYFTVTRTTTGTANYSGLDLNNFSASLAVVPEPTTWALLAGSLTALVIFRKRRRA